MSETGEVETGEIGKIIEGLKPEPVTPKQVKDLLAKYQASHASVLQHQNERQGDESTRRGATTVALRDALRTLGQIALVDVVDRENFRVLNKSDTPQK